MAQEKIDVKDLFRKRVAYNKASEKANVFNASFFSSGKEHGADSVFFDPYFASTTTLGNVRTISRTQFGGVPCKTLRAVAEKAWIINTCINHVIKKIKPFLKPSSGSNTKGFVISRKDDKQYKKRDKEAERIENFILETGNYEDTDRDNFVKYCTKVLRDLLTIDQIATEIQYNKRGEPCAFFAVDSATVEKVAYEDKQKSDWRYIQVVDGVPAAAYTPETMLFDYENPRTDIHHSQYGYSYVEQAVDLVTSVINTFVYNSGNFTENKLPKGMLLVNGDLNQDDTEQMVDYISELMSASPLNQWRIPVIPSGGKENVIEWKQIQNNREMEFQAWLDYLTSGIVAMYGCSMDELGLQSQKSQNMFENSGSQRIEASKSLILGDILTFLESYINRIIKIINPEYRLTFVGYELEDSSKVADLDEKECRTWKSINEKRAEKGLDPIDLKKVENPADIPMNVQLVQMFQAQQGGGEMEGGMGDDFGGEDEYQEDEFENEPAEESTNEESFSKSFLVI